MMSIRPICISRVGCVSCSFQSVSPATIICSCELEQAAVSSLRPLKNLEWSSKLSIALPYTLKHSPCSSSSWDIDGPVQSWHLIPKWLFATVASPAICLLRFFKRLVQINACRYSVALHFSDCYVFIFVKVVLVSLVPTYIRTCNSPINVCQNCNYNDKSRFITFIRVMCGLQIYIIYIEVGRLEF